MEQLRERLSVLGVVPVVLIDRVEDAVPLARALGSGGLPVVEVTFRTGAAAQAIAEIKQQVPDMLVGAGTVLTVDQLEWARKAGADFMVSPGLNYDVVGQALSLEIPFIPGCMTPSEIEQALDLGLDTVKFFPAEAANAKAMIPALNGPYPGMHYMPTGGITLSNLKDYLSLKGVFCCGGSWIAPRNLVNAGDFRQIEKNASEVVEKMKEIMEGGRELSSGL